MDVTPSKKMFDAMGKFVDALCGEEPSKLLVGPAANAVRQRRAHSFDFLHGLVAIAMQEGVNRKVLEIEARRAARDAVFDSADRRAKEQAKHDAEQGGRRIHLKQ